MRVRVDTRLGTAVLEVPEDTAKLSVVIVGEGDPDLPMRAFGRIEGDHAWLDADSLKAAAAGRVRDEWIGEFNGMLDYARAQGWINDAGEVRAHVEREDAPAEKRRRFLR